MDQTFSHLYIDRVPATEGSQPTPVGSETQEGGCIHSSNGPLPSNRTGSGKENGRGNRGRTSLKMNEKKFL